MAKPSVLVTGGAGYLGSIMVPELLNAGYRVTVLDNFMFRQSPLNHLCVNPDFDVQRGDARDEAVLRPLIKNADYVIPLAALVGAPLCSIDQPGAIGINRDAVVTLTRNLSKDQRILMPITNSGYGIGEKDKFCTEETPLRPISLYGRTKVEAEQAALERGNAISFRLATVFGMAPRLRLDLLVNDFVYRAVFDRAVVLFEPHFKRNFIHVRDVTRAFLHGMSNFETMRDQAYNVGLSDANLSKQELCERIKRHLPAFVFPEAPVGEDPDKRDYIVSNAKIEATGFQPAFSLDAGIQELIKGYRMIRNSLYGNV
ncbi:NAD(P)-dependent oxidoreductase [Ferrovibrio terrae]|uniref:NAD(P)-dependent oxidoreductase n=1 Tax=Ferrovibrio terrae TaxID=2594003 RepID=A0A516GXW8_9PROT|nr:NAD(P)-dependent oxidoreductase [Ferrovibrio terrae]QDO96335.1 NAD(P)-dependent oxidoreductase [Ferrovibrio terrae]